MQVGDTVKSKITGQLYIILEKDRTRRGFLCESLKNKNSRHFFFAKEVLPAPNHIEENYQIKSLEKDTIHKLLEYMNKPQSCPIDTQTIIAAKIALENQAKIKRILKKLQQIYDGEEHGLTYTELEIILEEIRDTYA